MQPGLVASFACCSPIQPALQLHAIASFAIMDSDISNDHPSFAGKIRDGLFWYREVEQ
jgi:hypothetical protein